MDHFIPQSISPTFRADIHTDSTTSFGGGRRWEGGGGLQNIVSEAMFCFFSSTIHAEDFLSSREIWPGYGDSAKKHTHKNGINLEVGVKEGAAVVVDNLQFRELASSIPASFALCGFQRQPEGGLVSQRFLLHRAVHTAGHRHHPWPPRLSGHQAALHTPGLWGSSRTCSGKEASPEGTEMRCLSIHLYGDRDSLLIFAFNRQHAFHRGNGTELIQRLP